MKPGDKYYDGPIVITGKSIEELDREFEEEAEKLKGKTWPEYDGE